MRRFLKTVKELGPLTSGRLFLKHYAAELGFTALAYLLLYEAFELQGLEALVGGITHHAVVLFLAIVLGQAFKVLPIWTEITTLIDQHKQTPAAVRKPIGLFLRHRINQLGRTRHALGDKGLELDRAQLDQFVDACFAANEGYRYVGTDSHVPSLFYKLYPTYLDEQRQSKTATDFDVRIVFPTESELRADHGSHPVVFEEFLERHLNERVHLLQVNWHAARDLAAVHGFPSTDLGIYGWRFVAFFRPARKERIRVYLRPIDPELKRQLREYFKMLTRYACQLRLEQHMVVCHQLDDNARDHLLGVMLDGYGN